MAENNAGNPADQAPAAGSELSIPKHRFDEVAAELRRVREEMSLKDNLYMQERQARMQQPHEEAEISPEETGLEPAVHAAVVKAAKAIAGKAISREREVFNQQIGILAGRTEKAELLASKGSDKAKYIPAIEQKQKEHYQATGGFLPANVALELLMSEEKDNRIRQLEARLAGKPADQVSTTTTTPDPTPNRSAPGAAGTRDIPTGGGAGNAAPTNKSFGEMSVEEMEAHMERQFTAGNRL